MSDATQNQEQAQQPQAAAPVAKEGWFKKSLRIGGTVAVGVVIGVGGLIAYGKYAQA